MDCGYRLLNYIEHGRVQAGVLVDGHIHPLARALGPLAGAVNSLQGVLEQGPEATRRLQGFADGGAAGHGGIALAECELAAPLDPAAAIYCSGANYRDHLAEMMRRRGKVVDPASIGKSGEPWFFVRPGRACAAGPFARVAAPPGCGELDWEAELAVVIGRPARDVAVADALQCVAGYMVANDLSARDLARRADKEPGTPFHFDWVGHKVFEGANPLGPWITPAAGIDPQNLAITLRVNGVLKQDSNTSQMIFSVAELIAHLSRRVRLHPGDVLLTGTPAGVGAGQGQYLRAGDRVRVRIEHLGEIETTIV